MKTLLRSLSVAIVMLCVFSCTSIPPLDPKVGDTGGEISAIAAKTDVLEYAIDIELFPRSKSLKGKGETLFLILEDTTKVELKLDPRFSVDEVTIDNVEAPFLQAGGIITIDLPQLFKQGRQVRASIAYSGIPHIALNAPWAGGFVWSKTPSGEHWIATAVQGEGCDLFWPCKDHFADKADITTINLTVPKPLVAVTNGVLQKTVDINDNKRRYEWLLQVPASDYNIALNIGPYHLIERVHHSVNGQAVPIRFWSLPENIDKASDMVDNDLLQQLRFFETQLGPYPWYSEKLGFVETPHLGMEHQTINAYGKKYVRDERGYDWLMHHELAHEWFGNVMTHQTINDAWLHEGFGLYMQALYSLYKFGDAAYHHSMYESYLGLINCKPVVQEGGITSNDAFHSDIYGKGGWALHTLKWLLGDELFWQSARALVYGEADYDKVLTLPIKPRYRSTQDFIDIVNNLSGEDYTWLFDIYIKHADLPELIVQRDSDQLLLQWQTPDNLPFVMPIPVEIDGELSIIELSTIATSMPLDADSKLIIDPNMSVLRHLPIIGNCEENTEKRKRR